MKLGIIRLLIILIMFGISESTFATPIETANKYAKIGHEAFKDKDFIKAGNYYEQAYKANKIEVYLENAITAYLNYSFDCLNDKDYNECIKYCEKVLLISPADNNAKEILSDVYYSRGSKYFYRRLLKKSLKDIQKSLKYSVLPEQKQKAEEMLDQIYGRQKHFQKPYVKKASNRSTVPELIESMELKIYGETFENKSINERISSLEKDVLGTNYSNYSFLIRVDNLKKRVLPELMGQNLISA